LCRLLKQASQSITERLNRGENDQIPRQSGGFGFAKLKQIVDAKGQFRSLAEPWADTGSSTGRLMIAVLSGLADVERDLIRTRTAEGRSRAQKRGQHMGRPSKLTDAQKAEARRAEDATLAELARSYDVGKSTISRLTVS
jgi:DNA invertase Pin-like site-specific DNA recombinase